MGLQALGGNMSKPIILIYDSGWGATLLGPDDLQSGCWEITFSPDRLREAQAVAFHIPTAPDVRQIERYPGQVWVAWSMESAVSYPQLDNLEYMRRFDLTVTYRLDSDLRAPYFGPETRDALIGPPRLKTAEAPAVYLASNAADK